jgi:hypothetical protein
MSSASTSARASELSIFATTSFARRSSDSGAVSPRFFE